MTAVAAVVLFTATAAGASPGAGTTGEPLDRAATSMTAAQKQAKRKALKQCGHKRSRAARKACRSRVLKRFTPKADRPAAEAPAATIDVRDDYFSPDAVSIESGDTILWVWDDLNHDPHNVTLVTGPAGVDRNDFQSSSSPAVGVTFSRKFTVPGTYNFRCSLHADMSLTVTVS